MNRGKVIALCTVFVGGSNHLFLFFLSLFIFELVLGYQQTTKVESKKPPLYLSKSYLSRSGLSGGVDSEIG